MFQNEAREPGKVVVPASTSIATPITYSVSLSNKEQFNKIASLIEAMEPGIESTDVTQPIGTSRPDRCEATNTRHQAVEEAGGHAQAPEQASAEVNGYKRLTHYYTPEQLNTLDDICFTLRRKYGVRVKQSELMRAVFDVAASDFFEKGKSSLLAQRLLG